MDKQLLDKWKHKRELYRAQVLSYLVAGKQHIQHTTTHKKYSEFTWTSSLIQVLLLLTNSTPPKLQNGGLAKTSLEFITVAFILHGKCNYSSFTKNNPRQCHLRHAERNSKHFVEKRQGSGSNQSICGRHLQSSTTSRVKLYQLAMLSVTLKALA